ncbi:MAG: C-GCAxxG-C-C family protein [Verrucomicrobiae bacterium]|nr:C-GCAxxG-C-C family protein [Verrucomicrobiae bacterium]
MPQGSNAKLDLFGGVLYNRADVGVNAGSTSAADRAEKLFNDGLCCSESVLQAVAENHGIKSELIPSIATGFCGGIARTGNVCGAVTGAVMAISIFTGRAIPTDPRDQNQALIHRLLCAFEERFGSALCRELIGCRLDTPDGHRYYIESGLRTKCTAFVRGAAQMAVDLLSSLKPRGNPAD